MIKSIKDVLESTTSKYKDKIIFQEINKEITYEDFYKDVKNGATFLIENDYFHKNIVIFIDKSIVFFK